MSTLQEIEAAAEKLPLDEKRELLVFLTRQLSTAGRSSRGDVEKTSELPRDTLSQDPAIGIWTKREDLPADSVEASRSLREKMMRRCDE